MARVDEKGNIIEEIREGAKIEAYYKVNLQRAYFVPRIRPYLHIDVGYFDLEGGWVWKLGYAHSYSSQPVVIEKAMGYVEIPYVGWKIPMPSALLEVATDHINILTLPLGTYKLFYIAVGPA